MKTSLITRKKKIALIGGGPAALFVFQRIVEKREKNISVTIFEANEKLGQGMPYSPAGANTEHVTNVSSNEIPDLPVTVTEWFKTLSPEVLKEFGLNPDISEHKVVPRLLFGRYLNAQFGILLECAERRGIEVTVRLDTIVSDIRDNTADRNVTVIIEGEPEEDFDSVIICSGHYWPRTHEGDTPSYFDSPYPPQKLARRFNHPIAIRGSSLTAIDAIRTLARANGVFALDGAGRLAYSVDDESRDFKIVMHSREGFLPAVRFHMEDPQLSKGALLSEKELKTHMGENDGFISLDFIFDHNFKRPLSSKEPDFYDIIKGMNMEEFVAMMMQERERTEAFLYLKREYEDARESIRHEESIYWKEKLTLLSVAMNYPAKYFSAEDMLRLQKTLMPLISLVIAFIPQSSCEELMALHRAEKLELISVGKGSCIDPQPEGGIVYRYSEEASADGRARFQTFIDCIGQPHIPFEKFPFGSLKEYGSIAPARLAFRSEEEAQRIKAEGSHTVEMKNGISHLRVPGVAINDDFQIVNERGDENSRVFVMAIPLIGGFNPDYSGLDFCEAASKRIVSRMFKEA